MEKNFYVINELVEPEGDDNYSYIYDKGFTTLEKAKEALNKIRTRIDDDSRNLNYQYGFRLSEDGQTMIFFFKSGSYETYSIEKVTIEN